VTLSAAAPGDTNPSDATAYSQNHVVHIKLFSSVYGRLQKDWYRECHYVYIFYCNLHDALMKHCQQKLMRSAKRPTDQLVYCGGKKSQTLLKKTCTRQSGIIIIIIIIIIISRLFRNAQLTMNRHKGARGDAEPGLTLIQVRFQ